MADKNCITVTAIKEVRTLVRDARLTGKRIALVPTMGYLHEGHLSLIREAARIADLVVTSIYVNPRQFGPEEDLAEYPRDLERDTKLACAAGTHVLFVPGDDEMYPAGFQSLVKVEKLTRNLCGRSRPWHFQGVTTVVAKLFNIVRPDVAVFGQKDAQQAAVIRRMIKDLDFDVELVVMPIVRESDGLAVSSRNAYLSDSQRREAVCLSRGLKLAEEKIRSGERAAFEIIRAIERIIRESSSGEIDYVQIVDADTLEDVDILSGHILIAVAVFFGRTRLIDNTAVSVS